MSSASANGDAMPDTAMVFAAGLGTRMRPVTDHLPKPLVRIAGRTMLDHMLDRLAAAGVRKAIVNVHYLADQIEAHLLERGKTQALPEIIISDERALLLDQGGGIARVLPLLGRKPVFLCNTDALWLEGPRSNLVRLAQAWDPARMDIAMVVANSSTAIGVDWPGDFTMSSEGCLAKREERQVAPFVYSGVALVKPELFAGATRQVFRLAPYFFSAAAAGRLHGVRLDGIWLHVGTPEAIAEAQRAMARWM